MPPTSSAPEPEVLTVAELAKKLRKGLRQTYEAIHRGEIQGCHTIGTSIRCSRVAVDAWLHGQQRPPLTGRDRMEMYR